MAFGEMGRWAKRAMMGAALMGGGEIKAEASKPKVESTEQSVFTPEVIKPEWRKIQLLRDANGQVIEDLVPHEHPGYEPQEIPGNKVQYIEVVPEGWHKERTPEGSILVKDCPEGFHVVQTPEGKEYVQNNPDGSDDPETEASTHQKNKRE